MAEERRNLEETSTPTCVKGKCHCKILCLKGLATIWKVLSILALVAMLGMLGWVWYVVIKTEATISDGLWTTLQVVLSYGFAALVFITISRALKTLRKIKHAVEHR